MINVRNQLHIFQEPSVTSRRYVDMVLECQVRLFRSAIGPEILLSFDNAPAHRAYLVSEYLHTEDITRMDSLTLLPELNPTEHMCDALRRRISAKFLSGPSRS